MDKGSSANSQNPTLRPDNPFANLPKNDPTNTGGVASSDSQLEELRRRVNDSAYANSAYDRANAFSVTNTREQPNIGVGGSATAYGGLKESDLQFLSTTSEPEPEPEPILPPAPEPIPEPVRPAPQPMPQPAPRPQPMPEMPPEAPKREFIPVAQPAPQPAPQPASQPVKKEKGGLSLPIIIAIVVVVIVLIGIIIWAIIALKNRSGNNPNPTPQPEPEPTVVTEEQVSYEEYNRRIDAKEAVNCTATYARASHTGSDYASGEYEIYSEKSWTVAADEGWNNVFVSNYDFRFNLADGSVLAQNNLRNSPASIYFEGETAYLWSVTLTPRAAGNGTAVYRLASYETVAPSLKLNRTDVESSFTSDFYETVKVSEEEINDSETGDIIFTCKDGGIADYQELINARKAEMGAGDAQ